MSAPAHRPDWLRDVPEDWPVALLRLLTRVESGHTPSRSHPKYWVPEECVHPWFTLADIWQLRDGRQKHIAETKERISDMGLAHSAARLLPAGTVALSRTASVGFSGIFAKPMATTQDFVNFVCGPRLLPDFLLWVLRGMKPEFDRLMRGSTHQTIYMPDLMQFRVPLPTQGMQRAIADFLDEKTAGIDALIEKKERLIALLAEKRAALIHQAVTKGLDPTVPMKPSGVPWIGDIPAHWETMAIKRFARRGSKTFTDGDWIESPYITEEGVRLIQTGNVGQGEYREKGFRYVSDDTFRSLRCTEVKPGDVLVCRLDGPVGRACLAPDLSVKMITSVDNAILKVADEHDARYLVYAMNLPRRLEWIVSLSQVGGGHRWRISRSALGDLVLPAPPREEQERVSEVLDEAWGRTKAAVSRLELQVERLREYRQALITAAVTGQLDIAGAAA